MAVKPISTFAPAGNAQLQALDRQRQLAMMLQNQSLQPMDGGRMVGNHFVPNHPMQGVAKLGQALVGNYKQHQADKKQKTLEEEKRKAMAESLRQYQTNMMPKPAQPEVHATPPQSNPYSIYTGEAPETQGTPYQPAIPEQPRTKQEQIAALMQLAENPQFTDFAMNQAMKLQTPQEMKLHNAPLNTNVYDVNTGKIVQQGTPEKKSMLDKGVTTTLAELGFPVDNPTPEQISQAVALNQQRKESTARAGASNITTQTIAEKEYDKKKGGYFGDMRSEIFTSSRLAVPQMERLNRMEKLLEGVDNGSLSGIGATVSGIAKSMGLDIDPRLGDKQAAISLANKMAIALRPPASGVMTDKDFEVFLGVIPDLSKTPEGRKEIMTTMRGFLTRDVEIAKMAREYEKQHGRLDEGFEEKLENFRLANPVFKPVIEFVRDANGKIVRKQ